MSSRSENLSRPPRVRIPLALVPLAVYVGVTLVEPALNGAASRHGFWEHAAITLAVSGAMTAIGLGVRGWSNGGARAAFRRLSLLRPRRNSPRA